MLCVHGMTFARLLGLASENVLWFFARSIHAGLLAARLSIVALLLLVPSGVAQEPSRSPETPVTSVHTTLPVNWVYGAYIPKGAPVQPLTGDERFKLYLRQTYTT